MTNIIKSTREQTAPHDGKACERVRAVTLDDGEAWDKNLAKTVVRLEDGTEVIVINDEIRG